MSEPQQFKLQRSKIYLMLAIFAHSLGVFAAWFYDFNIFISLILSVIFAVHFYYLNLDIALKKPNSIQTFTLNNKTLSTLDNTHKRRQYPQFYCVYQSRFLVIISLGKRFLVIFKDSFAHHSLSKLNRLLNART
jgi:uncharacterized protein YacL